jgi:cobaltochelatase CobS
MLNHAQLDRWNVVSTLVYLPLEQEVNIVAARVPAMNNPTGRATIASMVALAGLTRKAFDVGDCSTVMSPRTVMTWADNCGIFANTAQAFAVSFLNKCDASERPLIAELYQRCMGESLTV